MVRNKMAPPPQARKFGAPLFFCTFTESSDEVVLGGGGGSSSTGVANRLLLVKTEAEGKRTGTGTGTGAHQCRLECDPAGELHTGAFTCVNGTWVKSKQYFISVMSGGDLLVKYRLDRRSKGEKDDELQFRKIDIDRSKTKSIQGAEVKSIASNFTGAQVAVGLDTGKIVIFETDKMEQVRFFDPNKHSQVPPKGGVMNLSYSSCGTRVVAVKDNGFAFIWDTTSGKKKTKATPVTPFESATPGGMFRGCYSYSLSKDTSKTFFCLGENVKGKSFLTTWSMEKGGKKGSKLLLTRKVPAHQSALTALAGYSSPIRKGKGTASSAKGEKHLVATACSEGEIAVYSLEHGLTCLVRVPNAHMIFVTNLAFSNDGGRLVSVSADAGARITSIVRTGDQVARERQLKYAVMFLLLAMIIYYFFLNNM